MDSLSVAKEPNPIQPTAPKSTPPVPVEKPSWFRHPIQRLKYQINEIKSRRNPDPAPAPTPAPTQKSDFLDDVKLSKGEWQQFNQEFENINIAGERLPEFILQFSKVEAPIKK